MTVGVAAGAGLLGYGDGVLARHDARLVEDAHEADTQILASLGQFFFQNFDTSFDDFFTISGFLP